MEERLKDAIENLAGAANFHLIIPTFVNAAVTDRTIDKPAQIAAFKFPGGTLFLLLRRAVFNSPAGFAAFAAAIFARQQKVHLPLNSRRYRPPALFIAVNGLQGGPQQLRHLFLGFVQL
jgi:hypothetical protein